MILTKNSGVSVGAKPSVLDIVKLQGATKTPLLNMIGKGSVKNILHSWITDQVRAAGSNAQLEVSGVGATPDGTKQKTSNVTQIIKNEVMISMSQEAVDVYGKDELKHQLEKGALEHALDIEYSLFGLHNADKFDSYTERVANTTAAKMAGIFNYVPTSHRNDNSGTPRTLDMSAFEDVILPLWENNNSTGNIKLFCSPLLQKRINEFAKDYIQHKNRDNTVDYRIMTVMTSWGNVDVIPHRFFTAANSLENTMLALDPSSVAYKTLIPTKLTDVPTEDTAVIKRYYTEGTLEVKDNFGLVCGDDFQ